MLYVPEKCIYMQGMKKSNQVQFELGFSSQLLALLHMELGFCNLMTWHACTYVYDYEQ